VGVSGTPITLGATEGATSLIVVGSSVFYVDQRAGSFLVQRAAAGQPGSATTVASGDGTVYGLAHDSGFLFFARAAGDAYNIACCDVTADAGCADMMDAGVAAVPGVNVVLAPPYLVWADGDGDVTRLAIGGGEPSAIATSQPGPDIVASDGTSAFWTNDESATIFRGPLGDLSPVEIADTGYAAAGLAVDDAYVYWSAYDGASAYAVIAAPKGGGPQRITLASGVQARWLAQNGTAIFWAEDAAIFKVRKP
jgi:hypothetical protein